MFLLQVTCILACLAWFVPRGKLSHYLLLCFQGRNLFAGYRWIGIAVGIRSAQVGCFRYFQGYQGVYENKRMCTTFVSVFSVCMSVCVCKIGHGRWLFSAVRPALASKVIIVWHTDMLHYCWLRRMSSETWRSHQRIREENCRERCPYSPTVCWGTPPPQLFPS